MDDLTPKESVTGRHPIFWLDDGSLVLQVEAVKFKLRDDSPDMALTADGQECAYIRVDSARKVSAADCEALLQHLYHDKPLRPDSPFPQIASVVRASSPRTAGPLSKSGPAPFIHPQHLEEALALATSFSVTSIQKGLLGGRPVFYGKSKIHIARE
ncbi:BTB domain-containing protein [Mycena sanguinolenta]|uniref:BTB domain-containing protein n=1 Tax=Mycena sanguinolenta TaxID=230812 RepID=A0A8H6ZEI4_9AGAR|nr:BTB domain-containing protein [Mycena sanguinolenta]